MKVAIPEFIALVATGLLAGAFMYGFLNVVPTFYGAGKYTYHLPHPVNEPQRCDDAIPDERFHYCTIVVCSSQQIFPAGDWLCHSICNFSSNQFVSDPLWERPNQSTY